MLNSFFDWLNKNPLLLWLFAGLFVVANIWYDYLYPAHATIDGILIFVIVCFRCFTLSELTPPPRRSGIEGRIYPRKPASR